MSHKDLSLSVITLKIPKGASPSDAKSIMDQAVNRLYEIQLEKRRLETEDDELRDRLGALMGILGMQEHNATSGHRACIYDSKNIKWDSEKLEEILTEEQYQEVRQEVPYQAIRIS